MKMLKLRPEAYVYYPKKPDACEHPACHGLAPHFYCIGCGLEWAIAKPESPVNPQRPDPLPHIGTKSGRDETIVWRGSVTDLATDIACALKDEQIAMLATYLCDRGFVAKKRARSGG